MKESLEEGNCEGISEGTRGGFSKEKITEGGNPFLEESSNQYLK